MANSQSSDPQQSGGDRQGTVVDDDPTLQTMILDDFVDDNLRTPLTAGGKEMLRLLVRSEH
jgi:hypothetical protein